MRIQYASDLHINTYPAGTPFETFVRPAAPILVLAGDICSVSNPLYAEFLTWCKHLWPTIVLIAGNHEYFCEPNEIRTMEETDQIIQTLCWKLGIYFLQGGQSISLPGTKFRFVGATLWSAIDPMIWPEVQAKKREFQATFQRTQNQTIRATIPSDLNSLHAKHRAYLASAFANKTEKEIIIVVTHHMPTTQLLEAQYQTDRWRSCYASEDEDLFVPNITAWICGHGHRATQKVIPLGPLLLMNARGYPDQVLRSHDPYNPEATFFVKN